MQYSSKERMMASFRFEKPDRVPVFLNNALASSRAIGAKFGELVTNPEKFSDALCAAYEKNGSDGIRISCDVTVEAEAMGGKAHYPEDAPVSLVEHALADPVKDFQKLKMPDPAAAGRMPIMLKTTALTRRRLGEDAYIAGCISGPANIASQLLGVNNFMMMVIDDGEFLEKLLDFTAEVTVAYGKAMYKAGADCINMGEAICSVNAIGPVHYVELVKKRHTRVVDELNSAGIRWHTFHICGGLSPILSDVAQTGVASLDIDSPVDMRAAREQLGKKVTMIGNIAPAELLNSTPERVAGLCKEALAAKEGLGLILGAGCTMAPDTPDANINAMVQSAKDYGKYE